MAMPPLEQCPAASQLRLDGTVGKLAVTGEVRSKFGGFCSTRGNLGDRPRNDGHRAARPLKRLIHDVDHSQWTLLSIRVTGSWTGTVTGRRGDRVSIAGSPVSIRL